MSRAIVHVPGFGLCFIMGWLTALTSSGGAQPALSQLRISNPLIHASAVENLAVIRTNYHGWSRAWAINNGVVEAVVVPAIGRIMEFHFLGEDGPFWQNRGLDGRAADPHSDNWSNFGGDKSWPAPQSDWPKITPRAWPPPAAFDSLPAEATVTARSVLLVSSVDPAYGIREQRLIELDPRLPVMTVTTTFEKVQGEPVKVGIWTITQLRDPDGVFLPIPKSARSPTGFVRLSERPPPSVVCTNQFIQLARNGDAAFKIGSDAAALLWVGAKAALRLDGTRDPAGEYPDQGSSVEVYTNPDPAAYVELEMLSPLQTLKKGDQMSRQVTYTLFHRSEATPLQEAQKLLATTP